MMSTICTRKNVNLLFVLLSHQLENEHFCRFPGRNKISVSEYGREKRWQTRHVLISKMTRIRLICFNRFCWFHWENHLLHLYARPLWFAQKREKQHVLRSNTSNRYLYMKSFRKGVILIWNWVNRKHIAYWIWCSIRKQYYLYWNE